MKRILLLFALLVTTIFASLDGWRTNLNDAKEIALHEKKPIILFLHSPRCFYCPKIIENVFPDKNLQKFLKANFIMLTLDTSTGSDSIEDETSDQAPERFQVSMTPAFIFMGPKEEKLARKGKKHMIIYGFWNAKELEQWGKNALQRFKKLYGDKYEKK